MNSRAQHERAGAPVSPRLHQLSDRIGEVEALDQPARRVSDAVGSALSAGAVKDALSGTWLGHALHPVLTDLPIGAWTSAAALDLVGGERTEEASQKLIAVGLLAALPTAATGFSDWADTTKSDPAARRVGLVHAAANTLAMLTYAASLGARRRGKRRLGKALAFGGAGLLTLGGQLGGHLVYARGVGVDQTVFERLPSDWVAVIADAELAEGETRLVHVEHAPVLVTRQRGRVYALAARCAHRGGPLHKGEITDGSVTCPWHGSVFRLEDGSVERGPAAYPQPTLAARVSDGQIEVRRPDGDR